MTSRSKRASSWLGLALFGVSVVCGIALFASVGLFSFVSGLGGADADELGGGESLEGPGDGVDPEPATFAVPSHAPRAGGEGEQAIGPDPEWIAQTAAAPGIPERALTAYAAADIWAADTLGCAAGWNTLAGIGWVESHHGSLQGGAIDADGVARPSIVGIPLDGKNGTMAIPDTDGGELDGDTTWDRAVGPMQFIP
ncbi:MAG: murein transglycosylase, partial [Pseudoclavibacter sp.]